MMEDLPWKSYPENTPAENKLILVEVVKIPERFEHDYTRFVDGSDRTSEELESRKYARKFYTDNKYALATTYRTWMNEVKIMVQCNYDSRHGFIVEDEISRWCVVE